MEHQDLRLLLRVLYTRARSRDGGGLPQVPVERDLQPCIHDDPASAAVHTIRWTCALWSAELAKRVCPRQTN